MTVELAAQIRSLLRGWLTVLLLLLTLFVLSPVSKSMALANPSVKLTPEEQKWLDSHPGLKIGIRETPPLVMTGEKGEGYQGLSIDYIKKVEKLLGVNFTFVEYPTWSKLLEETKKRNVDILVTGTITLDRASYLDFTPPYIQLHNKVILKKDNDAAHRNLEEMGSLKVAAVEATAVYKHIEKKYPEIKLVPVKDEVAALEAVSFGDTYAAVMEMARASYYIDQEKITNLIIGGDAGYLYNFCFSSRNDWSELQGILTKALDRISAKERREISDKWLHSYKHNLLQSRTFWTIVGSVSGILIVAAIFTWNIVLRRKVEQSTAVIMNEVEQLANAESELRRLNRTLMVLGKSHELLIQFTEEIPLYNAICRHLIEVGGYRCATVFCYDGENAEASSGYCLHNNEASSGYLSRGGKYSSSIAMAAINGEKIVVERSITGLCGDESDEDVSALAIPVWGEGIVIGALEIISVGTNAFDDEEVSLLTELVENMAYAVVSIRLKERHRGSEELVRKLSMAVEQSPVSIVVTNCKAEVEYVNSAFTKTTGYSLDEIFGRNMNMLKSGYHNAEFYRVMWDLISNGFEWHGELCNRRKNGEIYWESASISPIRTAEGEITHYVSAKEDVTDQKQAYEELQKAKLQAEEATNAKSSFLANMSHEIRTPMNAVIGMLYLVQQSELTEKQKNYIDKAEVAAKSLLNVINDILDFSKIEAGRLKMECISFLLSEVLTKVVDIAPVHIGSKQVDLHVFITPQTPDFLNGDPVRLGQVLLNLVSNAIKFTEKGDVLVTVSSESIGEQNYRLTFSVEDSGIGMSREQMDGLFSAFTQGDVSTTRRFGGTGLGLTISKQLVELMGGTISVESEQGAGSKFSFTTEFSVEDGYGGPIIESFAQLNGVRVIHVSEESRGARATTEMLRAFGMTVTTLRPQETVPFTEPFFDLIIYDLSTTDQFAPEVFLELGSKNSFSELPAVMFASDRKLSGLESWCKQVNSIVVKPASSTKLLSVIMDVLGFGEKHESLTSDVIAVEGYFKGRRVLLVEDNIINQEVARGIMERWGVDIDIAANGEIAVQMVMAAGGAYDMVLMDLQMPVMDGFEATRQLRSQPENSTLPIIAMTASALTSDRELSLAAGMNDHVTKPVDVGELFSTLHRWLHLENTPSIKVVTECSYGEKNEEILPADIPGVELHRAMRRLGDRNILLAVLRDFRRLHSGDDVMIREAVSDGSTVLAIRMAHSLKGVALTIGGVAVGNCAAAIEKSLASGDCPDITPLLNDLSVRIEELNRVLCFLDNIPVEEGSSAVETKEVDPEAVAVLMRTFAEQLDKNNLDACTTFLTLKKILAVSGAESCLQQMERAVGILDFCSAKELLITIAGIMNIRIGERLS